MKEFTPEELESFDGKKGDIYYVSYKGKVYDVSQSSFWIDGEHTGGHLAGRDLTQEMSEAPHGDEVFDEFDQVGTLKGFVPNTKA